MTEPVDHVAWFERTGHCGQCGNPGDYCTCRRRCGCAELHPVSSGLAEDALDTFSDAPAPPDHPDLFG